MRAILRIGGLVFGTMLVIMGIGFSIFRRDPITPEWATLVEAVNTPTGFAIHLSLFHPETGFQRDLALMDTNALPENLRWTADGQWLLIAIQPPHLNEPSLYRVHWSGRHFAPIPHIQHSYALRAIEWSPDGQWGLLLETRQYRGDVLLIDETGETVHMLVSDLPFWIVGPYMRWSPDGRWAWGAFATSDTETAVYRIDGQTFDVELLPPLMGTLEAMVVSPDGEWITYALRPNFGDPIINIFRSRPDGSDTQLLARSQLKFVPDLWWTEAGDLMARVEELAGTNYYIGRVDAAEQAIIPVVEGLSIGSRLQWSPDRRYMATELVQDGAGAILIIMADGRQQWQYPAEEFCMFFDPRWSADDEWVTFLRRRDPTRGVCEFHQVQAGSDDVQPLFDRTLIDYELDTSAADHPHWISTFYRQRSEPQQFLPSLIHRETGEIIHLPNGHVATWSKIPIRTEDSRLAIVVGILCLAGTIVGERFLKYWV